jgi:hypothetical protein
MTSLVPDNQPARRSRLFPFEAFDAATVNRDLFQSSMGIDSKDIICKCTVSPWQSARSTASHQQTSGLSGRGRLFDVQTWRHGIFTNDISLRLTVIKLRTETAWDDIQIVGYPAPLPCIVTYLLHTLAASLLAALGPRRACWRYPTRAGVGNRGMRLGTPLHRYTWRRLAQDGN